MYNELITTTKSDSSRGVRLFALKIIFIYLIGGNIMNSSLIQPYFVMSNSKYYKSVVKDMGISHFYTFNKSNTNPCEMIAVPDGCIDILFKCDKNNPTAEVCGSVLQAQSVITSKDTDYFGVRFYPGQGYAFKDIATNEIINHQIPLNYLLDAEEMITQIASQQNFGEQIKIFMQHYTQSHHKSTMFHTQLSIKKYMVDRIIESHGLIRIKDLASEMGYSERYIHMKFIEFFGLNPKMFCKIIRFQHILNTLNNPLQQGNEDTLLQVALDAGYYDQSHMIKDFRQLAKNTPTKYLDLLKDADYNNRLIIV